MSVLARAQAARDIAGMSANAKLATVAACAGDPARASMLSMLMDGRAFTAGELSAAAGVTPQTASGHLSRMVDAGLLAVAQQGRHRYFKLASPQVGRMLEGMMVVAAGLAERRTGPASDELRFARTCYDHLAGQLGVAIAQNLQAQGHIILDDDGGAVTDSGRRFLARIGLDPDAAPARRAFCKPCLDWSERRYHIGGLLGQRIAEACFRAGWIRRARRARAVEVTALGRRKFREVYGVDLSV